jgi:hypothetical protein
MLANLVLGYELAAKRAVIKYYRKKAITARM